MTKKTAAFYFSAVFEGHTRTFPPLKKKESKTIRIVSVPTTQKTELFPTIVREHNFIFLLWGGNGGGCGNGESG